METFISMLRGINVSGQKKIQMSDLKSLYEDLAFREVSTYIQSGNVIFKTSRRIPEQALATKIQAAIRQKYRFDVPVIIRSLEEMSSILAGNPFTDIETNRLYITLLNEAPAAERIKSIPVPENATCRFEVRGREIYLYEPDGYGNTRYSNNFFERALSVTATTRNWNTLNKLAALAATH